MVRGSSSFALEKQKCDVPNDMDPFGDEPRTQWESITWSNAWNSTHHGRYVFPSLKSAASLSISSLSLCLSPCAFAFGASAMEVNAWTCALATASDLESAWRSMSIRTRRMVNCACDLTATRVRQSRTNCQGINPETRTNNTNL